MLELSNKEIKRYNYIKTKEYVDDILFDLKHLGTKLMCLTPPDSGRHVSFLDKVQESKTKGSKIEKYIEKKDYIEREIKKELSKIEDSILLMTPNEKLLFEEVYIYQNTDFDIEEKLGWSHKKVLHIKKSFVIKIALSRGKDFENK